MYDSHLGGKLALNVLYLAPEHEGLQDLMQSVDDNHSLLHGYIILPSSPGGSLAEAVTKPLGKLVLVIKHLNSAAKVHSCSNTLHVHTDPDILPSFAEECNFRNWSSGSHH